MTNPDYQLASTKKIALEAIRKQEEVHNLLSAAYNQLKSADDSVNNGVLDELFNYKEFRSAMNQIQKCLDITKPVYD